MKSEQEITAAVLEALAHVAPEVEPDELEGDEPLRDQVDIDSMDFLNFLIKINETLGVEIPEADYPSLETLDAIKAYVAEALSAH